jgi:hypothetical protein
VTYVEPRKQIEPASAPLALPPASPNGRESVDTYRHSESQKGVAISRHEVVQDSAQPIQAWIESVLAAQKQRPWLEELLRTRADAKYARAPGGAFS